MLQLHASNGPSDWLWVTAPEGEQQSVAHTQTEKGHLCADMERDGDGEMIAYYNPPATPPKVTK